MTKSTIKALAPLRSLHYISLSLTVDADDGFANHQEIAARWFSALPELRYFVLLTTLLMRYDMWMYVEDVDFTTYWERSRDGDGKMTFHPIQQCQALDAKSHFRRFEFPETVM